MTLGCNDIETRKSEFVAKTQIFAKIPTIFHLKNMLSNVFFSYSLFLRTSPFTLNSNNVQKYHAKCDKKYIFEKQKNSLLNIFSI